MVVYSSTVPHQRYGTTALVDVIRYLNRTRTAVKAGPFKPYCTRLVAGHVSFNILPIVLASTCICCFANHLSGFSPLTTPAQSIIMISDTHGTHVRTRRTHSLTLTNFETSPSCSAGAGLRLLLHTVLASEPVLLGAYSSSSPLYALVW